MRKPEDYAAPVEGPLPVDDEDNDDDEVAKPRARRKRVPVVEKTEDVTEETSKPGTNIAQVPEYARQPGSRLRSVDDAEHGTWHPDPPKPEEDWAHRTDRTVTSKPDDVA